MALISKDFEDVAAIQDDVSGVGVVHAHLGVGVARQAAEGRVHRALAQGVMGEVVGEPRAFMKVLLMWVFRLVRSPKTTLSGPCSLMISCSLSAT